MTTRPLPLGLPKRILIVEDNYDNRAIYQVILRHAGYQVIEAVNGDDGVTRAREHEPDLILMDLSMPIMNGWEALAELRRDTRLKEIPVLALSAHVLLEGDYQRALDAGFVRYLTKPLEPKEVLEAVRQTIGAPGTDA